MLGILLILFLTIYLAFFFPIHAEDTKYSVQLKKLWSIAQTAMRERKPLRAEKALLTILKFDEKNAAAYNRLGILYAKSAKFAEAIECFEIAQSLDNNASSLHNAGLIYLETGAYEKASMAFQQAIKLEGDLPARHIALAKAEEKLGHRKVAIESLETAFELAPTTTTLRQILALYEESGDTDAIAATTARIEDQLAAEANARKKKKKTRTKAHSNSTSVTSRIKKAKVTPKILYPKAKNLKTDATKKTRTAKKTSSPAKATTAFPRTSTMSSTASKPNNTPTNVSTTRRTMRTTSTNNSTRKTSIRKKSI